MVVSKLIGNPQKSQPVRVRVYAVGRYILGLDLNPEFEKCLAVASYGFLQPSPKGVPEAHVFEMQVVATAARKSSDPVMHLVLSWEGDEGPTTQQFHEILSHYVDFFNLQGHQVISGLHQDTDNLHIHFLTNRHNRELNRTIEIDGGFTRNAGAGFCAFLENKFGWKPSDASYAYWIDDQPVLSDLYRLDSAQSHIRNMSNKFQSPSHSEALAQLVKPIIESVSLWVDYQARLASEGIKVVRGNKGGLVFISQDAEGKQIPVACSRVYHGATEAKLNKRLAGQFDPDFSLMSSNDIGSRVRSGLVGKTKPKTETYGRYSSKKVGTPAETSQLRNVLKAFGGLMTTGRLTFWKNKKRPPPGQPAARRVHLLDRARGDSSNLSLDELDRFAENIAGLHKSGWHVELKPDWPGAVSLIGPPSVLRQLHSRGLFPRVSISGGPRAEFVFDLSRGGLGQDAVTFVCKVAEELGCEVKFNQALTIASPAQGLHQVSVSPAMTAAPLKSLISDRRAQVIGELENKLVRLADAVETLATRYLPMLARLPTIQILEGFLSKSKLNIGELDDFKPEPTTAGADTGRAGREFNQRPQPRASAASGVVGEEGSTPHRPVGQRAERQSLAALRVGEDHQWPLDDDEGGDGRVFTRVDSDARGISPVQQRRQRSVPENAAQVGRDIGPTAHSSDGTRDVNVRSQRRRSDSHVFRMIMCRLVAKHYNLQAAWSGDVARDISLSTSTGVPLARVTRDEIKLDAAFKNAAGSTAEAEWLRHLQDRLSLAVIYPEPLPPQIDQRSGSLEVAAAPSFSPDIQSPDEFDPQLEHKPFSLLCDVTGQDVNWSGPDEVYEYEFLFRTLGELGDIDLTEVASLTFYVSDFMNIDMTLLAEIKEIVQFVRENASSQVVVKTVLPEDEPNAMPQTLVLVYNAPDNFEAQPDEDTLLIAIDQNGDLLWPSSVSLESLKRVVLHTQNLDAVADVDQDMETELEARQSSLQTLLQPPLVPTPPEFMRSEGDLADQPWQNVGPEPGKEIDNGIDYGM